MSQCCGSAPECVAWPFVQIETKAVGRAGTVELAEGVRVPKRFSTIVRPERADTLPYNVELMVGVENGRFVVDSLTARRRDGGPPVTSDGLRDVPVASLLRQAAQQMLVGLEDVDDDSSGALVDDVQGLLNDAQSETRLRAIARSYRVAALLGDPPTQAVADAFGVARSTAGRWIAQAREMGVLGPALPRRAGEGSH